MEWRRRSRNEWQRLVAGWPRSGLTQEVYCARHGISVGESAALAADPRRGRSTRVTGRFPGIRFRAGGAGRRLQGPAPS